jgi:hypothetical protein
MWTIGAILEWFALGEKVIAGGTAVIAAIKKAAVDNGIDADTAALNEVSADAARRKALAEQEAGL